MLMPSFALGLANPLSFGADLVATAILLSGSIGDISSIPTSALVGEGDRLRFPAGKVVAMEVNIVVAMAWPRRVTTQSSMVLPT